MGPNAPASPRWVVWDTADGFLLDCALKECFSDGENGLVITVVGETIKLLGNANFAHQ